MSLALIEAAREYLHKITQEKAQAEETARAKAQEVSAIRQLSREMFSDCMDILKTVKDEPTRDLPPMNLIGDLFTRAWGHERRISRTYRDDGKLPIRVILDGWPLHRNDPYAHLQVTGLPDSLHMSWNPRTRAVESYIEHNANPEKQRDCTSKSIEHPSELQPWRELVDFLKGPQQPQ